MTDFYLIIGLVVLVGAVGAALKIGMWVWIMTSIFGRPQQQYRDEPVVRSGGSGALKKWLTIIATILGIISTTVGLVEKCGGEEPRYDDRGGRYVQPVQQFGSRCCTPHVTCPMMTPGLVGSVCTCVGMGGVSQGTVCR